MKARVTATPIIGRYLQPGDLFSTAAQAYWDTALSHGSVGERVYIRTNIAADQFHDADETVYRIVIEQEG